MLQSDSEYLKISYDAGNNLLLSSWLRPVSSHELHTGLQYIMEEICNRKIKYWLDDTHLLSSPDMADQRKISEIYLHYISCANIQKIAYVVENDIFHQIIAHKIGEYILNNSTTLSDFEIFTDTDNALRWLEQQAHHNRS